MSQVHLNDTESVAYLPAHMAVVSGLPNLRKSGPGLILGAGPTQPVVTRVSLPGDDLITYWGDGNDFPQQVIAQATKNPIIDATLSKKAALWIGGGVFATADEDSETPVDDAEIRAFMTDITTERYLLESSLDMAWFNNGFPEFILSKNREKVVQLHANETAYCRWGRMNERSGELDSIYLNANWPQARASDQNTIRLPVINPYQWDRVDAVRKGKAFKYVYPISYPSPGKSFYQLSSWDSIRSSGWLDYQAAIPQFKKYGMENQMSLKYHIKVPVDYWEKVYGERWENADYQARIGIRDEFLAALMEKLTNVQNAHKAVLTDEWYDHKSKSMVGVVIEVLDDKTKDGKFLEDNAEANANAFYAMGLDPTMVGFTGSNMAGRSGGSDKREAFWIFLSTSKPYRDRILEPLRFTADYNGWTKRFPRLTFKFRDTLLTTLDTGKSTLKENTSSTPAAPKKKTKPAPSHETAA